MIEIKNVTKIYKDKEREVKAVDDVSLNIKEGEIFGVIGYSGAGKSTLIRMINGLEVPTTGEVIVDGEKIDPTDKKKLQRQRSRIGMIFQGYNLLKTATVLENVMLPLKLKGLEKELAEHNMLVDLGRNDIGRISRIGSVEVERYMEIQRYSHIMHIGSTVRGIIRDDMDALNAVDSILPAGTLSGAPKLKACELICELENNKRGIYGGAIGYIDFTGNLDTCIAIRLAFAKNGKVFVRSGAGIVADSVPENEFEECINKAKAVMNALKEAEGGIDNDITCR